MTEQFETATVVIREILENDIPAVLEIYAAAGLDLDERFTVDEARAHLAVFRRYPSYKVYVAELAGKVVGTYELLVMDNLAKRGKKSAIIEDVAVHPFRPGKRRGQGDDGARTRIVPGATLRQDEPVEQFDSRRCTPILRIARVQETRVQFFDGTVK